MAPTVNHFPILATSNNFPAYNMICPEILTPTEGYSKHTFKNGVTAVIIDQYIDTDTDEETIDKRINEIQQPIQTYIEEDGYCIALQGNKELQQTIAIFIKL